MKNIGDRIQDDIYKTMHKPDTNRLPVIYEEWEELSRKKLADGPFYYVAGGAGGEQTMDNNLQAFKEHKIVQRMHRNVKERDLSIELLGKSYPYPIFQAPIGVQSIIHPEGEIRAALASAKMGVPYIASSAATVPMEKTAEAMGDSEKWYQLYWSKDCDITASFLKRAETSGYLAIVVTLDTPMMAWRENDLKNVYLPFLAGEGVGNYFSDPAFCGDLKKSPQEDPEAAIMYWTQIFGNSSLTWEDIAFVKEHTTLPIILKGIVHPEDAKKALEVEVDGIIVSNHGGRQVDGAIAALDALPGVCEVIKDQIPVLMDSGIRRGSDIIKAMALGAKAVLIGRPLMYGLAVYGQNGVEKVLQHMIADLDITLGLVGEKSVRDLDKNVPLK